MQHRLRAAFAVHRIACIALLSGLYLAHGAARAADDSVSTDRPDIANSPDVVGGGRWQLEAGIAGQNSKSGGLRQREASTPLLLRIGLGDALEFRLSSDGRRQRSGDGIATERGWADTGLGFKWHLADGGDGSEALQPAVALLVTVTRNTGTATFRGAGARTELDLALGWDLPAGFDLSVMPGLYRDRNDQGGRFTGGVLAVSLGKAFNDRVHGFVELAAQQLARRRDGGNVLTLDTGVSYLLRPDLQVDAALFRGLNRQSPDWQWTIGVSRRF